MEYYKLGWKKGGAAAVPHRQGMSSRSCGHGRRTPSPPYTSARASGGFAGTVALRTTRLWRRSNRRSSRGRDER